MKNYSISDLENESKKITYSKQTQLMAVTIIAASIVEAMIIGINNSQNLQKAMVQELYQPVKSTITHSFKIK